MPGLERRDRLDIRALEGGRDQLDAFVLEPEAREPPAPAHVAAANAGDHALRRAAERRDPVDRSLNFARRRGREVHQRAAIGQPSRELMIGIIAGDRPCRAAR